MLKAHNESVKVIACVERNRSIVATGSRDGSIFIYDLRCNQNKDNSYNTKNQIHRAHVNNTQTTTTTTPKSKHVNSTSDMCPISGMVFDNENYLITCGATDNVIKLWDTRKLYATKTANLRPAQSLYNFKNEHTTKGYSNLLFNQTLRRIYANCMNNVIYEFDLETFNVRSQFSLHKNSTQFVKSCLSLDENFLLTGSSDSQAYIYPLNYKCGLNCLKLENAHQDEVTCVDWSPHDINQLITCSDDNSIRLWHVKNNSIDEQSLNNLFKCKEIEETKSSELPFDDNLRLFNQKFYHNTLSTGVYNDLMFTYAQKRAHFKSCRVVRETKSPELNVKIEPTKYLPINLPFFHSTCLSTATVTPRQIKLIQTRIPFKSNENTPQTHRQHTDDTNTKQNLTLTFSTSKKRPLDKIFNEVLNLNSTPPSSKRRLIMEPSTQQNDATTTPNKTSSKSILDYFSPKSQFKK